MKPSFDRWVNGLRRMKWQVGGTFNCVPTVIGSFVIRFDNKTILSTDVEGIPTSHHHHTGERTSLHIWNRMYGHKKKKGIRCSQYMSRYPIDQDCVTRGGYSPFLLDGIDLFETTEFKAFWDKIQTKVDNAYDLLT